MSDDCTFVSLSTLGMLRAHGPDALAFLQGQLSNDVLLLRQPRVLLAGYHNPQGRVIALLRLVARAPDDVFAILPRELVASVAQRLGKFTLRAKVKLTDESAHWQVGGLIGGSRAPAAALPAELHGAAVIGTTFAMRIATQPARWLCATPLAAAPLFTDCPPAEPRYWQRLSVAAGEPQVYAATSEEFVAQMLNLDALGAIAYDKGCYTGQEVIARAHYRGRVKRRLQRFVTAASGLLQPADTGVLEDGRHFKVVDAAILDDGRCEFLAVTPTAIEGPAPPAEGGLRVLGLPLPYALPELS
jgi:tRNA-modifying protein YgfZ